MSVWDKQVGGSHYQHYKIQPSQFFIANKIPYVQAAIIKYVLRYQDKNGIEDLEKAKHMIDMLIEEELINGKDYCTKGCEPVRVSSEYLAREWMEEVGATVAQEWCGLVDYDGSI